jgi:hypothetical protein
VVLKEGKHLSAREVETEKRRGKSRGNLSFTDSQIQFWFPPPLPSFASKQRASLRCLIHR